MVDNIQKNLFWGLWNLSRPRTAFLGVFAYLLGLGLSGVDWTYRQILCLMFSFLVSIIANLHNAIMDLHEDSHNLPGRVKLVNEIGRKQLYHWILVLTFIIISLCSVAGLIPVVVGFISLFLLFSYSGYPFRAKAYPIFGLIIFSMVGVIPYLLGY